MNRDAIDTEEGTWKKHFRKEEFDDDDSDNTSLASFETVQTVERVIHNQTNGFIFLILLQLETKKFEIIQVPIFTTATANYLTIGDILNQISIKATDLTLANQYYRGICRPTNSIEMVNLSAHVFDEDGECRIVPGEVLVPIPEHHSAVECMRASQFVLNLPAVDNLFQKFNPLAPKKLSSGRRDAEEMNSFDIKDVDRFRSNSIDEGVPVYPSNVIEVESLNENLVEVVIPKEKSLNISDLIESPIRTLRKYEEQIVFHIQKKIPLNNQRNSRSCARFIVKGTKLILAFVLMRSFILAGIHCLVGIPTNITKNNSTERPFIVRFVEFISFLSFLIWFQKRNRSRTQNFRLSQPRKLVYGR